jgi:hypothetical protein
MTRLTAPTLCFFILLTSLAVLGGRARAAGTAADEPAAATAIHLRPTFNAAGLGLYPINLGFELRRLSLRPYVAFGGNANVIRTHVGADQDGPSKVVGVVAQARLSVGATYQPVRSFAFSAELGYAPWSAGLVVLSSASQTVAASVVDLSFGVRWL